jgi:hypothetical protein
VIVRTVVVVVVTTSAPVSGSVSSVSSTVVLVSNVSPVTGSTSRVLYSAVVGSSGFCTAASVARSSADGNAGRLPGETRAAPKMRPEVATPPSTTTSASTDTALRRPCLMSARAASASGLCARRQEP